MFAGASCKACSICNPSLRTTTKLCMGASIQAFTGDHKYHKCTPPCHGETHRWKFTASCLRTRSWLNTHVHTLGRLQEFASTRAASSLLGPADPDGCYARGGDCQPLGMQCVPSHLCCCACRNAWVPDWACSPCRQLRRHRGPADMQPLPLRLVLLCQVSAGAPSGKWCSSSLADGPCCTASQLGGHAGILAVPQGKLPAQRVCRRG